MHSQFQWSAHNSKNAHTHKNACTLYTSSSSFPHHRPRDVTAPLSATTTDHLFQAAVRDQRRTAHTLNQFAVFCVRVCVRPYRNRVRIIASADCFVTRSIYPQRQLHEIRLSSYGAPERNTRAEISDFARLPHVARMHRTQFRCALLRHIDGRCALCAHVCFFVVFFRFPFI